MQVCLRTSAGLRSKARKVRCHLTAISGQDYINKINYYFYKDYLINWYVILSVYL